MKKCNTCGIEKTLEEFPPRKEAKDGRRNVCRVCTKERQKKWSNQNRDKINKRNRNWAKQNRDYLKQYREKNREILNVQAAKRDRNRFQEDKQYRFKRSLGKNISLRIKKGYGKKAYKTLDLLGCDWTSLRDHLEKQFRDGMSWDNYGINGWHIDHIKPCDSFDLTDPKQQKECWNWRNLQPLWWWENLKKSNKYP